MPSKISRSDYAAMYGPTTGDRLRLADTDLIIEVEKDLTAYGEEVKFGGGKVIRDGMGQSQVTRAAGAVDTVITNALIVDHSGVYKADVGLKDGRIHKIGKAGNPDTQPSVDIIVGPGTEAIAGEGKILTAGAFDSHIHFICRNRWKTRCIQVSPRNWAAAPVLRTGHWRQPVRRVPGISVGCFKRLMLCR